jgi:hypothetical protein
MEMGKVEPLSNEMPRGVVDRYIAHLHNVAFHISNYISEGN